jgi:hypothetical protein
VIFAVIDSLEDVVDGLGSAFAGGATAAVRASVVKAATTSLRIVSLLDR